MQLPSGDTGVTLVELLIAMGLSVMLLGVLGATLVTGVRGVQVNVDSYQNSADALSIATYLPQDIQSVASPSEIVTKTDNPSEPIGCTTTVAPLAGETHLFKLRWAGDTAIRTLLYTASYRLAPEPATKPGAAVRYRLTRYFCNNGGTAKVTILARSLSAATAPAITKNDAGFSATFVDVGNGQTLQQFTVSGQYRLALAGGTTSEPTFSYGCGLLSATVSPNPGIWTTAGALTNAPVVTVTATASCSALTMTYAKGATGTATTTQSLTLVPNSSTWTAPLDAVGWTTDGAHDIEVKDATTQRITAPFTVLTPKQCLVSAVTTSAPSGTRKLNPSPNTLMEGAITVTATATDCNSLTLSYAPAGTAVSVALTQQNDPTQWATTIPSSQTWTDGVKTFTVTAGGTTTPVLGTATFVVTPKTCTATSMSVSPSSLPRKSTKTASPDNLSADVTVTVMTDGVCSGLRLRFTPDSSPTVPVVRTPNLTESSVGNWTYVILSNGNTADTWSTGSHAIDALLTQTDTTAAQTKTLTVT